MSCLMGHDIFNWERENDVKYDLSFSSFFCMYDPYDAIFVWSFVI